VTSSVVADSDYNAGQQKWTETVEACVGTAFCHDDYDR